ncbi:DUF6932 family protein [Paraburkholderia tropica]|uniref:DUF6932 family protein n=1 Tax=Paraburkholderia tropica TaxID=92647 RepID=UPI003D27006E
MSFDEFKQYFGYNEHRLSLLAELESFLQTVGAQFSSFRVLAFGSFITDKEKPGDFDLLMHITCTMNDQGFRDATTLGRFVKSLNLAKLNVHGNLSKSFPPDEIALKSAQQIVDDFNDAPKNRAGKISCTHAIELAQVVIQ